MVGVARLWPCRRRHRFGFFSHDKPKALRSSWPRRSGRLHSELTSRGRALVAGDGMGVRGDCKLLFFLEGGRVWAFQPGKESPKSIKGQVSEPAGKAPPRRPGPAPGAPGAAPPTVRAAPRTSGPRLPGATERLDPLEAGPPIQIQSPQSSFPMVLAPPRGGGCGGNDPLPSPRTDYKHR